VTSESFSPGLRYRGDGAHLKDFVDRSQIPMLPSTCCRRCRKHRCGTGWRVMAGWCSREVEASGRESNIRSAGPMTRSLPRGGVVLPTRTTGAPVRPLHSSVRCDLRESSHRARKQPSTGSHLKRGLTLVVNLLLRVGLLPPTAARSGAWPARRSGTAGRVLVHGGLRLVSPDRNSPRDALRGSRMRRSIRRGHGETNRPAQAIIMVPNHR